MDAPWKGYVRSNSSTKSASAFGETCSPSSPVAEQVPGPRDLQIPKWANYLSEQVRAAHELLSEVEKRLAPVTQEEDIANALEGRPPLVPVAQYLSDMTDGVEGINNRLRGILRRLEL